MQTGRAVFSAPDGERRRRLPGARSSVRLEYGRLGRACRDVAATSSRVGRYRSLRPAVERAWVGRSDHVGGGNKRAPTAGPD